MDAAQHHHFTSLICLIKEFLEIDDSFEIPCPSPFVLLLLLLNARLPRGAFPFFRSWGNWLINQTKAWMLMEGGVLCSVRSFNLFLWAWDAVVIAPSLCGLFGGGPFGPSCLQRKAPLF